MAQRYATRDELPSEFSEVSDDDVGLWLELAEQKVSLTVWGDKASLGHRLLTSHLLKRNNLGSGGANANAGQALSSVTVGNVSKVYARPTVITQAELEDAELMSTTYGQAFLQLRKGVRAGPLFVGEMAS